jgi:hypothetical protein
MDLTLDQLLSVIGRLDDNPGFDTPRERFRRFLVERMTSFESACHIIQQCREYSGEQSHRALQDGLALMGRFLGFDTTFGRYHHDPGAVPVHGDWQSRRRLQITLILCTDQTAAIDLHAAALAAGERGDAPARIVLLIVTPLCAGKERLEQALAGGEHPAVRLVSLRGLLRLAKMVEDRQLTHEDVLQVFNPAVAIDACVDLIDRAIETTRREPASPATTGEDADRDGHERRFWVNAMRPDPFTPTDRIVGSLIASRQILGINPGPGLEDRIRAGDAICVFIAGRGIVAHAEIAGILADGSKIIRDSKRYTHVLRLTDVVVYETPVVPNQDLARKLDLALADDAAAITTAISQREFDVIASHALSQAG